VVVVVTGQHQPGRGKYRLPLVQLSRQLLGLAVTLVFGRLLGRLAGFPSPFDRGGGELPGGVAAVGSENQ